MSGVRCDQGVTAGTFSPDGGIWTLTHAKTTGDSLFRGGAGAAGRSFSDFSTIMDSIRERC